MYKIYKVVIPGSSINTWQSSDVDDPNWILFYEENTITKARPGSLGIFVFLNVNEAMDYSIYPIFEASSKTKPKKVEYIGNYYNFWRAYEDRDFKALIKMSIDRRLKKAMTFLGWHHTSRTYYTVPKLTLGKRIR